MINIFIKRVVWEVIKGLMLIWTSFEMLEGDVTYTDCRFVPEPQSGEVEEMVRKRYCPGSETHSFRSFISVDNIVMARHHSPLTRDAL